MVFSLSLMQNRKMTTFTISCWSKLGELNFFLAQKSIGSRCSVLKWTVFFCRLWAARLSHLVPLSLTSCYVQPFMGKVKVLTLQFRAAGLTLLCAAHSPVPVRRRPPPPPPPPRWRSGRPASSPRAPSPWGRGRAQTAPATTRPGSATAPTGELN